MQQVVTNHVFGSPYQYTHPTVWEIDTRNVISDGSLSNQFKIPFNPDTSDTNIDFMVDWGDGNFSRVASKAESWTPHTYATEGIYTIKMYPARNRTMSLRYENSVTSLAQFERNKLLRILSWGKTVFPRSSYGSCVNLSLSDVSDTPTLPITLFSSGAFNNTGITKFKNLSNWVFADGLTTANMFSNSSSFNDDVNFQGKLTSLSAFFTNCTSFNSSVNIDTSLCTSFSGTFQGCTVFNQPLNHLNISSLTNLSNTFRSATAFNQPLNNWDVSKVTLLTAIFYAASSFNQNLNSWNTSSVTNMNSVFRDCPAFNQPLNNWNTSNVTLMGSMFFNDILFNQPLNNWDVSKVIDMSNMFRNCPAFNQDISSWNFNINVDLTGFMVGKSYLNYNAPYYDNLLIKLASIMVGSGRTTTKVLNMGTIRYTSAGASARASLVADGWTITDGGLI